MNRIWYYTPSDRSDHPDINLLTPGMGVLTALCVCLIPASAHLPQLPNPFHILFGYTTLVALNLLWQGRSYFRPRSLPSPMLACDGDRLTAFDRDGACLGTWRLADIAELRATEPDPVAVIRGGAAPEAVWLEIVLREAAPSGLGESDRLRRWLDAIEPQRGQIAIHVHLSEAVPSDHAPTTRLHLGAAATDTLADALGDIDQYHQGAALPPPRLRPFARLLLAANIALITLWLALNIPVQQGLMTLPFAAPALPLLELPPFHLHAMLPFGAYPHANALVLLSLTALNLAAWLAPWHWQAE